MAFVEIHPENPQENKIKNVVEVIKNGGVIIYPTDSVYAFGCDMNNTKAVERVIRLRGMKVNKAKLSFICSDISQVTEYTKQLDNQVFKMMKKGLPGPYTFILNANNKVPKILNANKKTVGVRIPDNKITQAIVEALGYPLLSTSLKDEDQILEYSTDPWLIKEMYENQVDLIVDGGNGNNIATTVLDCTGDDVEVIREGLGDISIL